MVCISVHIVWLCENVACSFALSLTFFCCCIENRLFAAGMPAAPHQELALDCSNCWGRKYTVFCNL